MQQFFQPSDVTQRRANGFSQHLKSIHIHRYVIPIFPSPLVKNNFFRQFNQKAALLP